MEAFVIVRGGIDLHGLTGLEVMGVKGSLFGAFGGCKKKIPAVFGDRGTPDLAERDGFTVFIVTVAVIAAAGVKAVGCDDRFIAPGRGR